MAQQSIGRGGGGGGGGGSTSRVQRAPFQYVLYGQHFPGTGVGVQPCGQTVGSSSGSGCLIGGCGPAFAGQEQNIVPSPLTTVWNSAEALAASSPPVTTVTRVQRALVSHEVEPLRPEFRSSCGCELKSLTTQSMLRRCVYAFLPESPSTRIIEKQRSGFYRD